MMLDLLWTEHCNVNAMTTDALAVHHLQTCTEHCTV